MPRLIAFGCSNTYGQGLEDCHILPNFPGPSPSKTAWPNTLGNLLNCSEVINQSKPVQVINLFGKQLLTLILNKTI